MSLCYDLDLENSKPIFLYAPRLMVRHHNMKFGNKMLGNLEDVIWTNTNIFYPSLLPWPWMQLSNFVHKTLWLMMVYHQTKSGCQGINNSEDIVESHILIIWALAVTWLWRQQKFLFHMTFWLMMLHHHTKFGNKTFCSSGDIIWTNIQWHFELLLWPWPWMQ